MRDKNPNARFMSSINRDWCDRRVVQGSEILHRNLILPYIPRARANVLPEDEREGNPRRSPRNGISSIRVSKYDAAPASFLALDETMSRNKPAMDQVQRWLSRNCSEFRWKTTTRCDDGVLTAPCVVFSTCTLIQVLDTLCGNATGIGFDSRASIGRGASFPLSLSFSILISSLALPRGNEEIPNSPMGFADGELEKKSAGQGKDTREGTNSLPRRVRASGNARVGTSENTGNVSLKVHPSRADS